MLGYVLEQAGMSEIPTHWADAARRLRARLTGQDPDENILRVLDASTAHLTERERERLNDGELANQAMTGAYGGMVYVSGCDTPHAICGLDTSGARPDGISDTLWAIYQHAADRGCAYILFDSDAPFLPGFPVFET
jgi:hypothetical protein